MKIESLQTMRFFAALGVLQFHLWRNYFGIDIVHPGTDFFVVLVGVVTALTQAKRIPEGNWFGYIQARYIRLYITFIPLFIIVLLAKWYVITWDYALKSFFFIPVPDRSPVITVAWMLSMFMLFYFVFSLTFVFRNERILWFIFLFWTLGIVFYTWLGWSPGLPAHWSELFFFEKNLGFIFGYLVGVILRERYLGVYWGRQIFWFGAAGVVVGTVLLNFDYTINRTLFVGLPVALFILGLANLEQHRASDLPIKILTLPWLVWLGGTSYVLYLSHSIYLRAWEALSFPFIPIMVPVITLGAIIVGVVGYILWEEPLLTSIKKKSWTSPRIPCSIKIIELRDKIKYKSK